MKMNGHNIPDLFFFLSRENVTYEKRKLNTITLSWAWEGLKEGYISGYNVDFYQCSSPLRAK